MESGFKKQKGIQSHPLPNSTQLTCSRLQLWLPSQERCLLLNQGWHFMYYTKLGILSTELEP